MSVVASVPTAVELNGFRAVQQLAYQCAEEVAGGLDAGVTEKEAAARMRSWLEARGVEEWFHVPFAWFGDRTAFRGFRSPRQFFPTDRRLEDGMPFILDCAPVQDGFTADIGFTGVLGTNAAVDRILDGLAEHRTLILDRVRAGAPLREVYEAVDALAARQGFVNRHRAYPGRVIAHQVHRLRPGGSRLNRLVVGGFGVRGLRSLARSARAGRRAGTSPLWAGGRASDHPATPGFWAVEPHLGFRGVGAKFEELLVVTGDDAFWLDDDLPHVRRWSAARGAGASPRPAPGERHGATPARPDEGRVVVVTGAGSGIGRQTALAFAERGAHVVAVDIDADSAARTATLCHDLGATARDHQADVGDVEAMEALAKQVETDHGAADVVVNNAGIAVVGGFLDTSIEDWERVLRVNLWGVIHGSLLLGRQMVARGEGGHIVNVASGAAFTPSRTYPAYATSKAAVLMLSECLQAELASEGIGVSAICPGVIDTGIVGASRFVGVDADEADRRKTRAQRLYARRGFTPDRVADAIVQAVEHNRAVVPVAPEATAGRLLSRLSPSLARRLARLDASSGR